MQRWEWAHESQCIDYAYAAEQQKKKPYNCVPHRYITPIDVYNNVVMKWVRPRHFFSSRHYEKKRNQRKKFFYIKNHDEYAIFWAKNNLKRFFSANIMKNAYLRQIWPAKNFLNMKKLKIVLVAYDSSNYAFNVVELSHFYRSEFFDKIQ